jgi:plasmid maintenance system antidote protein VapI
MAIRLGKAFGGSADVFIRMQASLILLRQNKKQIESRFQN